MKHFPRALHLYLLVENKAVYMFGKSKSQSCRKTFSFIRLTRTSVFVFCIVTMLPTQTIAFGLKDAANLVGRLGGEAGKEFLSQSDLQIPKSMLDPSQRSGVLEKQLEKYVELRNDYDGMTSDITVVQILTGSALGFGLAAGGPVIPFLVLGLAAEGGLELGHDFIEGAGRAEAGNMLAAIAEELVVEAGVPDAKAILNNPKLIGETIRANERFLSDLKARAKASGDDGLLDTAVTALEAFASDVDAVQFDIMVSNATSVNALDAKFGKFMSEAHASNKRIEEKLDDHANLIKGLKGDVTALQGSVAELGTKLDQLGHNQDLMADFMYSGLDTTAKVRALNSGLMDKRIVCPKDRPQCDKQEVKAALIKRFTDQARVEANIKTATSIAKGLNDVVTIADNLGIDIGRDGQKAIQVAGAALNAYVGFASGDYLGALASVTSMFGKRKDPDAERFKIMMNYLRQQFEVVNLKLDKILENQKTILDAVVSVSKQLDVSFRRLDGRLGRIDREQTQMSNALKQLTWSEWANCYSVYSYALRSQRVHPEDLRFKRFNDVRAVVDARATQAKACMNKVTVALDSMTSTSGFNNFLDLSLSLSPVRVIEVGTVKDALKDEANKWYDIDDLYRNTLANPSAALMTQWALRHEISPEALFWFQASNVTTIAGIQKVEAHLAEGKSVSCSISDPAFDIVRPLICIPGENHAAIATKLSTEVLEPSILVEVVNWMTVVSQLGNLYKGDGEDFADTLEELATYPDFNPGREIIERLVDAVTLAMASQARIYGGATVLAVTEDILEGRADTTHKLVLANNPYLAENVATLLLYKKRGTWDLDDGLVGPSFEKRYAQAFVAAKGDSPDRFVPLYALFGRDHAFTDINGRLFLQIFIAGELTSLALPTPHQLVEGRLVYPPRFYALSARRDQLIERLIDYRMAEDEDFATLIASQ